MALVHSVLLRITFQSTFKVLFLSSDKADKTLALRGKKPIKPPFVLVTVMTFAGSLLKKQNATLWWIPRLNVRLIRKRLYEEIYNLSRP